MYGLRKILGQRRCSFQAMVNQSRGLSQLLLKAHVQFFVVEADEFDRYILLATTTGDLWDFYGERLLPKYLKLDKSSSVIIINLHLIYNGLLQLDI